MNNPRVLDGISKNARAVFFVSLGIFLISLIPVSYSIGYSNGLTGAAGAINPSNPVEPPVEILQGLTIGSFVTVIAGVITSVSLAVSAVASVQKVKIEKTIEEMKLKAAELEYQARKKDKENQIKEIEKLHLELETEKRGKRKRA